MSDFNEIFSRQIFEKSSNNKLMKTRPVGAELFHTDERTDGQKDEHDDSISRFSKFLRTVLKTLKHMIIAFCYLAKF